MHNYFKWNIKVTFVKILEFLQMRNMNSSRQVPNEIYLKNKVCFSSNTRQMALMCYFFIYVVLMVEIFGEYRWMKINKSET